MRTMYEEKQRIQREIHQELKKKYRKIHIWHIGDVIEGNIIFVSQSKKDKGMVIAEISNDGFDMKVRQLRRAEFQDIQEWFDYQAEPHDFDNFKRDVWSVEKEEIIAS